MGIAAFGVMMYLNNLVTMTMLGINQGVQPLMSRAHGSGEWHTIHKLRQLSLKTALSFSLAFWVICQLFPHWLVGFFIAPSETASFQMAVQGLRFFSFSFLISGFNVVISGYLAALRYTRKATAIAFIRGYVLIALSLIWLPAQWQGTGIWLSPVLAELITCFLLFFVLRHFTKTGPLSTANM